MNIIVCIKQVPDTNNIRLDPQSSSLIRAGVPGILNPYDKHALEAAVTLKEKWGGRITVITMGPPQAEEALRECLAMGGDEAFLLSDRAFAGADTIATSYTLSCAIKKLGIFDLIICGLQSIDGNTAQVGPQIAELLDLPQVTCVQSIEFNGSALILKKAHEDGYEKVQTVMPVLLTVDQTINVPHRPPIDAIMDSYTREITAWSADDLSIVKSQSGLTGSPTLINKIFAPVSDNSRVEMLTGTYEESVQALIDRLKEKHLLPEDEGSSNA